MKTLNWKGSGKAPQLTIPEIAKKYKIPERDIRTAILHSKLKFPEPSVGIISSSACKNRMKYYDQQKFLEFWAEHTK